MALSATPNTAAQDLSGMLSAGNNAAADKTQGASLSGADTFGNLLSDRMAQDAARRRADAQSAADDAASRGADIARKDAARANAARNGQDVKSAANPTAQATTTPAATTQDAVSAKPAQSTNAKDLDAAAAQAVIDPAAQLAAQIEAARQAAQQAAQQLAQQTAVATSATALPAAQPAVSQSNTNTAAAQPARATQGTGNSTATDAAALAALNAAANGTPSAANPADPTAVAQGEQAALQAAKAAQKTAKTAGAANTGNTPTLPATALPDGNALAQTLARTRAVADNTPPAARQLGSVSSAQNANGEHSQPKRADSNTHSNVTQTAPAAVADATSHAGSGGNTGTQADAQGNGTQFQGILARANGDASAAAPTFAVGTAGATGATAGATITPAQVHTLPTFGDAAWPHSMASQLAFMQVHRQSSAELQLNPAELGGLNVKLEVDNGAVNASFVCQHQAVAELVQDAMPRLRDAMQQGGMQLAQTSVSTGDFSQQQGASQGSSTQGNGSGHGGGGSGSRFGGSAQGGADTGTVAVTSRASSHVGVIDTFA
ncbi:flagellar hook-length control protein FliK [Ralstonia sp. UBA689]|uniref:flagellar hook-length control protein FliK n=1 Tax=Ralstonia sp. UBA689 TaxID=1947373 RepID=UPI0025FB4DA3|nr:flagellar hook-length control protein FliK [Ralstonia sp. UBA689]